MRVCLLNLILLRGADPGKNLLLPTFKLPAEKHALFGKFKWHAHGWADDAITRQNLLKSNGLLLKVIPRNKPRAYHVTISFSFGRCLHIVKVRIASIQGNFLWHAFKLFVFAKKCSLLIGPHRISLPYLSTFTARQRKGNVFAMKSPENTIFRYATKEKRTWRTHENGLAAKAERARCTQGHAKNICGSAILVTTGLFGRSKRPG